MNYILTQNHGKKIAVIENEFGAVNIDEDLVQENMQCVGRPLPTFADRSDLSSHPSHRGGMHP